MRRGWRRLAGAALAAIAVAALGWGVTRLLDSGADAIDQAPLVTAFVETDLGRIFAGAPEWQTYDFVAPLRASALRTPPGRCREWRAWALDQGGVDADQTDAYAYLQGTPGTAVIIDDIEIEVVRRERPMRGTSGHCPAGGAAGSPRLIDVDLDEDPPVVRYAEPGDDAPTRRRLSFTLDGTETESFILRGHTTTCYCAWRARMKMVVDGRRTDVVLEDDGEPFRTSASRNASHMAWDGRRWRGMTRAEYELSLPMDWGDFVREQGL